MKTKTNLRLFASLLILLQQNRGGIRFSHKHGGYIHNANGREVAPAALQRRLENVTDAYEKNVERLAERLHSGRLSLPKWQERMRREKLELDRTQYIVGKGGRDQMTPRDWGRLGADLRHTHYGALDSFALDIAEGKELADGTFRPFTEAEIKARSRLYVNSSNKQFWRGRTEAKIAAGFTEMRRFLNPAEHCPDCIGFAASGWVEIDTLPVPGEDSECLMNCRCTVKYRIG